MTNQILFAIALLAVFKNGYAYRPSTSSEETMCSAHEEIYFSCPVGKKIISVCTSGNISPESGYVQYRFGRPGSPELEFPTKSYPPKDRFSISDFHGGNINSVHLKFKTGGYTYVVFQSATSGVYVEKMEGSCAIWFATAGNIVRSALERNEGSRRYCQMIGTNRIFNSQKSQKMAVSTLMLKPNL